VTPKRLTRQESAARTRARLLDHAEREFLRRGYAAASLDRIAETAGYSKGAVYGNFAGKEELCLEVIDRHFTRLFQEFATELVAAEERIEARMEVIERWQSKVLGEHDWRLLAIEFAAQSRHNRRLQRRLADRDRRIRNAVIDLLGQQLRQLGLTPPLPVEDLAVAVMALAAGIAVQQALDPDIAPTLLSDAIRVLLTGTR